MSNEAIDLHRKLALFDDHWSPRTVAEYNGHDVLVVKVQGEFQWHSHSDTDDFFLVLQGELQIDLPDGTVTLRPGQMFIVPKGVAHRPRGGRGAPAADRAHRHTQQRRRAHGGAAPRDLTDAMELVPSATPRQRKSITLTCRRRGAARLTSRLSRRLAPHRTALQLD